MESVLVTLFCCLLTGLIAIVYSHEVGGGRPCPGGGQGPTAPFAAAGSLVSVSREGGRDGGLVALGPWPLFRGHLHLSSAAAPYLSRSALESLAETMLTEGVNDYKAPDTAPPGGLVCGGDRLPPPTLSFLLPTCLLTHSPTPLSTHPVTHPASRWLPPSSRPHHPSQGHALGAQWCQFEDVLSDGAGEPLGSSARGGLGCGPTAPTGQAPQSSARTGREAPLRTAQGGALEATPCL